MDWLKDFGGFIATFAVFLMTAALGWIKHISSRVHTAHRRIGDTNTRVAVLESNHTVQTELLREIKNEVKGMREDGHRRQVSQNEYLERFRLEVKADLAAKADK